jgi:S1-C subfamily serine protease
MLDMTILPSTTQPATQPAAGDARGYRLVPRGDGSFDLVGGAGGEDRAVIDVAPRSAGFVLDSQGHVLVPYFIERESVGAEPLTVACGDGTVCGATYVGSDPGTMLTILKLERPVGVPVALDGRRPADGSLVLFLSATGESARLQVWTGVQQDTGVVMGIDGVVHGFLRQGQFLEAARVAPVVRQILAVGHAKRQRVGVWIREVLPADALRREIPALRDRPAVFVAEVVDNTPAHRAGIRKGDLILSIGGETIGDPPTFAAAITPFQSRNATFRVLRDGREIELSVDLQRK